jgi:hypothetical protein
VQANADGYYDSNGSAAGGRTHFATLAGHPPIGVGAFLIETQPASSIGRTPLMSFFFG